MGAILSCGCLGGGGGAAPRSGGSAKAGSSMSLPSKEVSAGGVGHSQFIIEHKEKISEFYEVDKKKLGEGAYGTVTKAKNKSTGSIRAVKSISKAQLKNTEKFKMEIAIMKMMDHPNIVKLYETFEDHRNVYFVMELCNGGELFDKIVDAGHFSERQAAIVMQQIIRAVYYMHAAKICHRDLKPENFLFMTKEGIENNLIKIIDFGLSCAFTEDTVLTTKVGTPYYVAPQVLAGKYDQLCDEWSCGVIMYVLLCGYPPFFGETDSEVLGKVRLGNFSFNAADWKNVSEDAKNLIRMLLKMSPRDRFCAEQALNHEWIKKKAPNASKTSLQAGFVENLRGFRGQNKLKKAALHVIANQLSEEAIAGLRDTFVALDANGDGALTVNEMKEGIRKAGLKEIPADLQQIMESVDSDGSGVIDYTEFLAATLDKRTYLKEDVCWSAFRVFDRNGDGKISQDELKVVLNSGDVSSVADAKVIQNLLKEVDTNGDGFIDFQEFMAMMANKK